MDEAREGEHQLEMCGKRGQQTDGSHSRVASDLQRHETKTLSPSVDSVAAAAKL